MADAKYMRLAACPQLWPTSTPSFSNATLDATNDGVAWAFQARDANAITHLGFRYGLRTGTPPTYIIGLESISAANGNPDGTILGGGTPASATFTPPADTSWDGLWQWVALANSYTPTRGQHLVATIRYSSGTIDASNLSTFTQAMASIVNGLGSNPANFSLAGGTWSKGANAIGCHGVRTASTRYGLPAESIYNTRSASTVGHRHALRFTLPASITNTYTVRGIRAMLSVASTTGKNPILGLWNAGGVLQNFTLDSDWSTSASATRTYEFYFDETTLTDLSPGTTYYIGLEVADAASGGVIFYGFDMDSSDDGDAYPGGASDWCLSTYNGSAWTDAPTTKLHCELILQDMTQSGGGGGGSIIGPGRLIRA